MALIIDAYGCAQREGPTLVSFLRGDRPTPVMPVFETFVSLTHARRVAEHPYDSGTRMPLCAPQPTR
ncbi:hypothetical protein [Streptomyces sp. NPDC005125]